MSKNAPIPDHRKRAGAALRGAVENAKRIGELSNQSELAHDMEWGDRSYISQLYTGKRPMSRETVIRLAERLNCEPFSIADDSVRTLLADDERRKAAGGLDEDYFSVRETGVRYAAGASGTDYKDFDRILKFRRDWAEAEGVNPDFIGLVKICGNSMADQIADGDSVLVQTDKIDSIESGKPYALTLDGNNVAKRLNVQKHGIVIESDNRDEGGPPTFYTFEELDSSNTVILGLIWWRLGPVS